MNQRILVIDGHPVYGDKMVGFLKGLTFQNIHLVESEEAGIEALKREDYDLILLSSVLPDAEEEELILNVKAAAGESTKMIVQAGLGTSEETVKQFQRNGADIVLTRREKDLRPLQKAIENILTSLV